MFFRNLTLFRFSPAVAGKLQDLDDAVQDHRLRSCGPLEMLTRGFVPVTGNGPDDPLTRTLGHCTLVAVGSEDKLLPAQVVNEELARKVRKIAETDGRRVGGRERRRIKDEVLTELVPRAFVRSSRLAAYVDRGQGWLVLDTASRKSAENAVSQLRDALGSFPAVPLAPANAPRALMTDWLATGQLPAGLALGDECELRDPSGATGAVVRCRHQELDADEVREHLKSGKQVALLGLTLDERLSFVLGEDLVIRKLRFLDGVTDELADTPNDAIAELDATFTLLTLEVARLLTKLDEWFGLPRPAEG